jgi:inorganic pyrophosphatase
LIDHLNSQVAGEIADFFVAYNQLQNKNFKVLRQAGPERALELIKKGLRQTVRRKKKSSDA